MCVRFVAFLTDAPPAACVFSINATLAATCTTSPRTKRHTRASPRARLSLTVVVVVVVCTAAVLNS